jgi:probable HAF family extracellular repeat protein
MVGIDDSPGSGFSSTARDVSADGSVIVGIWLGSGGEASFRWSSNGGMVEIAPFGGARAVSKDGAVVVGQSNFQAYRWTEGTGAVGLGDLPGGAFDSLAFDVSPDGSIIVGHGTRSSGTEAFRWIAASGMVGLGDLPGGPFHSEARGVSADGSVVVGFSDSAFGQDAFRWTPETGMVSLGAQTTSALDVSADGTIILGSGGVPGGVFVWDEVHGLRSVQRMLGFDLSDWQSLRPQGISDDGTTIIGWGNHADLQSSEAWIAVLPEPSALALVAVGSAVVLRRRRRGGWLP